MTLLMLQDESLLPQASRYETQEAKVYQALPTLGLLGGTTSKDTVNAGVRMTRPGKLATNPSKNTGPVPSNDESDKEKIQSESMADMQVAQPKSKLIFWAIVGIAIYFIMKKM